MTREQAERYLKLKRELRVIQTEPMDIVTDSVSGSMPEFPYVKHTIVIKGISQADAKKRYRAEQKIMKRISEALEEIEDAFYDEPDEEMQTIIWGIYVKGFTQEDLADMMNCDQATISRRLKDYFEREENNGKETKTGHAGRSPGGDTSGSGEEKETKEGTEAKAGTAEETQRPGEEGVQIQ